MTVVFSYLESSFMEEAVDLILSGPRTEDKSQWIEIIRKVVEARYQEELPNYTNCFLKCNVLPHCMVNSFSLEVFKQGL